ncbi:MAG: hypothetical protein JWN86_1758 [Planctomycetota bacterium]|nr:hypothetical protein [Planctomycetota bacterium]
MSNFVNFDARVRTEVQPDARKGKGQDQFHYQKLAEAFLESCGTHYRYHQDRVLRYTGTRYVIDSALSMRVRLYLLKKKIPQNNNIIGNTVPIIQTIVYMDQEKYPQLPAWIGRQVNVKNLVAYKNGILDVERAIEGDHTLTPHTPDWVSLNSLPYSYDPSVKCPLWLSFLNEIFERDAKRIALLQEWFGYCLLPDPSRQKFLVMTGPPRSGKGTVSTVMTAMLGEENVSGYNLPSLAKHFGLRPLVGKLLANVGEVNLQGNPDKAEIVNRLKTITGCDGVDIETKYLAEQESVKLYVRFMLSCNEIPKLPDTSGAVADRLMVLPFQLSVPEDQRDPNLAAKLIGEIVGINIWAIGGLARLRKSGFTTSEQMAKHVNEVRKDGSTVLGFLQERCYVASSLDTRNLPGVSFKPDDAIPDIRKTMLAQAYEQYCEENDVVFNPGWFWKNLKIVLPKIETSKPTVNGQRVPSYRGLELKEI